MSAPAASPPPLTPPRSRWGWLALSAVLHGAFFVALGLLPDPRRERPADLLPIELIELAPPAPAGDATGPEPASDGGEAIAEPEARAEPEASAEEPAAPSRRPRSDRVPAPAAAEPAPAPPEAKSPAHGGVGLGLTNLRDQSRAGGGVPAPHPSHLDRGVIDRRVAVDQDVESGPRVSSSASDHTPRSLGEAGFKHRRNGKIVYRDPKFRFRAVLHPNGRLVFQNLPGTPAAMPGMSEIVRAAKGEELYRKEKKRLLEQTFELRLSMAVAWAEQQIDHRLRRQYRELIEVWSEDSRPAAARRRTLFERWDDCDEAVAVKVEGFGDEGESRIDEVRRSAATRARESIESFVRKHLPAGSPDAYPSAELAELNRGRHSKDEFDPYHR